MNVRYALAVEIEPAIAIVTLRRTLAAAKMGNVSLMAHSGPEVLA